MKPKYLIPIGSVGVMVSYYGKPGEDTTGTGFRYGEQVGTDERGVWKKALPPGKYALNLLGEPLSKSVQPLVPERMFMPGGGSVGNGDKPSGGNALNGLLPALLSLLVAEKSGLALSSEKKSDSGDQTGADTKSAGKVNS